MAVHIYTLLSCQGIPVPAMCDHLLQQTPVWSYFNHFNYCPMLCRSNLLSDNFCFMLILHNTATQNKHSSSHAQANLQCIYSVTHPQNFSNCANPINVNPEYVRLIITSVEHYGRTTSQRKRHTFRHLWNWQIHRCVYEKQIGEWSTGILFRLKLSDKTTRTPNALG